MTRYEEMLSYYVDYIKKISDKYYAKHLSNLTPCVYKVFKGRKYDKVVRVDSSSTCVHSFVEKETGKVWKAASYKAPAKNFPRADIYDYESLVARVSLYGV